MTIWFNIPKLIQWQSITLLIPEEDTGVEIVDTRLHSSSPLNVTRVSSTEQNVAQRIDVTCVRAIEL